MSGTLAALFARVAKVAKVATLRILPGLCLAAVLLCAGCGDDADGGGGVDAGASAGDGDAGGGRCTPRDAAELPDPGSCVALETDYSPCADDAWDSCVSDDGEYHRIEESISTIGRVAAFEEIAELLFDPKADASADIFLQARMIYQEDEGLDSRVVRRYDPHFTPDDEVDCALTEMAQAEPDYCVGPARIQPLILDALNAGITGDAPREQAARVEAGLLWFLYVSTYKESLTCADTAKDCDSSYAYYTGGEGARGGVGLARYVRGADAYAHDRAWDGLLAQRCWRDLDDGAAAEDLAMRDLARAQTDRAILHGLASVMRERLDALQDASGDERAYHAAFVVVLGGVLDREARARDGELAAALRDELAKDAASLDVDAARTALDVLFDCP